MIREQVFDSQDFYEASFDCLNANSKLIIFRKIEEESTSFLYPNIVAWGHFTQQKKALKIFGKSL